MPVYQHIQQAKRMEQLPMAQQVGACITCNWWNVETPRPEAEKNLVGRCVQPELKDFGLIVSGASGCNHWADQPGAGEEAHRYAERSEARA